MICLVLLIKSDLTEGKTNHCCTLHLEFVFYFCLGPKLQTYHCEHLLENNEPWLKGNWEWCQLNENHIGPTGRWFAETSEKQSGCLRAGCWNNLDWWVPFGQHVCALWNAQSCGGGPHETARPGRADSFGQTWTQPPAPAQKSQTSLLFVGRCSQ